MIAQGCVGNAGGHQRHHGNDTSCFQVNIFVVPVLAEQNIIVVMGKIGSELTEAISARRLFDTHVVFPLFISR